MAHIYLACATYDGKVSTAFAHSLVRTVVNCAMHDIKVTDDYKPGCCYIDVARNWLTHRFLKSEADAMLFVDSDIGWDHKAVAKLYQAGYDFVGGVPPLKQPTEGYPTQLLDGVDGEYREALYLPTGFLLVRRHVFECIAAQSPLTHYEDFGEQVHSFFQCVPYPDGYAGEDTELANRWRRTGGRVWCLPNINFEHAGGKLWHGNYGEFLKEHERTPQTYVLNREAA